MNTFSLLWHKILDSSIWMESKETRLVWITLLAMKDGNGLCRVSAGALAHRARVSVQECQEALQILTSPDPDSSCQTLEGRRLQRVEGGFLIVNHQLYQFSTEARREYWAKTKREQRARERSPQEARAYAREYNRRSKHQAACQGAQDAIKDGLKEEPTTPPPSFG